MLHKIRKAMGERDAQYKLGGIVEMDETYIGASTEGGKRGRGTDKALVVAALSLSTNGNPLFLKMEVQPNLKGETLVEFAKQNIDEGSTIFSDDYKSYNSLALEGYIHEPMKFDYKENPDHLKWFHTVISNAKAFIIGTFHGLDDKHLQAFLDEYCYRFNRRRIKEQLFNRLLSCCSLTKVVTYPELTR